MIVVYYQLPRNHSYFENMHRLHELPLNQNLMRPVEATSIHIPNFTEAVVFGNNDMDLKPEDFRDLFRDGQPHLAPGIGQNLRIIEERGIVTRTHLDFSKATPTLFEETKQRVADYAQEINIIRGLGVGVVEHAIVVVNGYKHPWRPEEEYQNLPLIVSVSRLIPGQHNPHHNLDISNPKNAGQIEQTLQGFQQYYTHDKYRPHLNDVTTPRQFSSKVVLMDIQATGLTNPGDEDTDDPDTPATNCKRELEAMYDEFDLSPEQIQKLQDDHTFTPATPQTERPSITLTDPSGEHDKPAEPAAKPAPQAPEDAPTSPNITAVNEGLFRAIDKTDELLGTLAVARRLAQEAADILMDIGTWVSQEEEHSQQAQYSWNEASMNIGRLQHYAGVARQSIGRIIERH
jgi:hypothetical protein